MAQEIINVGTSPNDGTGDPIRTAYIKTNSNFNELYSRVQTEPPVTLIGTIGDLPGMYAYDSSNFYYCFQEYDGSSTIWNQVASSGNIVAYEISNGTSNVSIPSADANVEISVDGTANVAVFSANGITLTGNVIAGNIETQGNILASGNIETQGYFVGNFVGNITGNFVVPGSNTQVIFNTSGNADAVSGFTYNKTSNLLSVSGNINSTNVNASTAVVAVGNIRTTSGYFIGDGSQLTNVSASSTAITNGTSQVQIGVSNGNANISINGTSNVVVVSSVGANVNGYINATGNIVGNNITGTLTTAAQPNITSIGSLSTLGVTGNIVGGNIDSNAAIMGATVQTSGNITGSNINGNGSGLSSLTFGNITTFSTAGLTTDELYLQGTTRLNVTASGFAGYIFDQYGANTVNPVIYVTSGQTLAFNLNVSGHPFLIQTDAGSNYSTGLEHVATTGTVLSNSSAQGQIAGTLYWKIPYGITGNYKYQCSIHAGMNGNIVVTDANVSNITVGSATTAATVTTNAQPNITSVGTLTSVTVTGNVAAGNLSVGTGTISIGSLVNNNSNGVGNIGSSSNYFDTIYAKATSAQYADLAEYYTSDAEYAPGTVLKFGGNAELTISTIDGDVEVAGIVTTQPAHVMNSGVVGEFTVAIALAGRVPCLVQGPVKRGQMLVSSGNGYARAEAKPETGSVVGKALHDFDGNNGTVEVVVGRL